MLEAASSILEIQLSSPQKQVQKHLPAPVRFPLPHLSLQTTRLVQTIRLTAVLSTSHQQETIKKAERAGKFAAASLPLYVALAIAKMGPP
jgi:hypothetical protein